MDFGWTSDGFEDGLEDGRQDGLEDELEIERASLFAGRTVCIKQVASTDKSS